MSFARVGIGSTQDLLAPALNIRFPSNVWLLVRRSVHAFTGCVRQWAELTGDDDLLHNKHTALRPRKERGKGRRVN